MGKVLIVDDSENSRNIMKKFLEELQHGVLLANDAFSARDLLEAYKVDLILLDLSMPNKSGFTLLSELRKTLRYRHSAVVVVSGRTEAWNIRRAANLNVLSYITKPFDKKFFLGKVSSIMNCNPTIEPPLASNETVKMAVANLQTDMQIIKVLEDGVIVLSRFPLQEGQRLQMQSTLLSSIGLTSICTYVQCTQRIKNIYQSRLIFDCLDKKEKLHLKIWIRNNPSS